MANLGPNFYPKLVQMTTELGMKPEDLIAVMTSESGMNPAAYNPHGGASGLIQFMPRTLSGLGFHGSMDNFRRLSGEEQLPWIEKYIKGHMHGHMGGRSFTSGGQYYLANLWPIALGLPGVKNGDPNTVILEKNPASDGKYSKKYLAIGAKIPASDETNGYNGNPLFDKEKKGYITLGDLNHQVDLNRKTSTYQGSIVSMQNSTGYKPSYDAGTPSNVTPIRRDRPSSNVPSMVSQLSGPGDLDGLLERFVSMLSAASDKVSLKKLYKTALPHHDILIQIAAPDYTSAIEFSRILCTALDEELLSISFAHTDGRLVEVECSINGPAKECFGAVAQLSGALAETFKDATNKIGGITVSTTCVMNKKSFYQPISLRTADTNYRKFLLKFI
jgi:hypothetical protein